MEFLNGFGGVGEGFGMGFGGGKITYFPPIEPGSTVSKTHSTP